MTDETVKTVLEHLRSMSQAHLAVAGILEKELKRQAPVAPPPPCGFNNTNEFRPPKIGEWAVNATGQPHQWYYNGEFPRWVLRPSVPKPDKAPDGYELTGEYRLPRGGEWYCNPNACVETKCFGDCTYPRWILRPLPKPTIESVYGKPFSELKPPDGWEWKMEDGEPAFRIGIYRDWVLSTFSMSAARMDHNGTYPRLILTPSPRKQYLFESVLLPESEHWDVMFQNKYLRLVK